MFASVREYLPLALWAWLVPFARKSRSIQHPAIYIVSLLWLVVVTAVARADTVLLSEALAPAEIKLIETRGNAGELSSPSLPDDGAAWNSPEALVLTSPRSAIILDLGGPRTISFMLIQADNNDSYILESSLDQNFWSAAWVAPPREALQGLRVRLHETETALKARYLRLRPGEGDGNFSVSRLLMFETKPSAWNSVVQSRDVWPGAFPSLTQARIDILKSIAAVLGLIAMLWCISARVSAQKHSFLASGKLMLLGSGILSLSLWWNLGNFHFPNYLHAWDFYHYYMGAKYLPEIGYSGLYDCTITADAEAGLREVVATQSIRNLHTNRIESPSRILADSSLCKSQFSAARWTEFTHDAAWFRSQMTLDRWAELKRDHGFNGTPVWAIAASLLAKTSLATDSQIIILAALDSLLLIALWLCVLWAFGWESLCVAAIFWGSNYPARYFWTGGSFLRQDWLFFSILGICLLRRERHFGAGAALAYAALLRIFPAFIAVPLILKAIAHMWRVKRFTLPPAHVRILSGALLVLLVAVPTAIFSSGRTLVWTEFAQNSQKHLSTPLTNNMGFKTLLGFDYETRAAVTRDPTALEPFGTWKQLRIATFSARQWVFWLLLASLLVFFWRVAPATPEWMLAVCGVGLIPLGAELTCYYYSVLMAFGFLWKSFPWTGVALALLAWLTCECAWLWNWYDESFTWMSALVVAYVLAVYVQLWRAAAEVPAD